MSFSRKLGDLTEQIYEKVLLEQIFKDGKIPYHVGIITDGNRRYAKKNSMDSNIGHVRGKEKLEEVLEWCMEIGTKVVTVFAFSTENFRRENSEVEFLFQLISRSLLNLMEDQRVIRNKIRVRVIGSIESVPEYLQESIRKVQEFTKDYDGYYLNIAVAYGGREEIIDGIKKIAEEYKDGKITIDEINEENFKKYLYYGTIPDPDLILRTSGEERVSNFLLWQGAYSELYFSDVYWPELRKLDFLRAVRSYQTRKRRYGT